MSRLSDLINQVAEATPALADDLRREVAVLSGRRPFGLNFERHVPETLQLPNRKIKRGDKVVFRPSRQDPGEKVDRRTWIVTAFEGTDRNRTAKLLARDDSQEPTTTSRRVDDLVVIAEFRDPIYPGFKPVHRITRNDSKPFHTVINGENFHVLEALTFAYEGKVDCIYIDPPYNTRDKDWKYNNDYVDSDDAYRHSKWLAMMERRLLVARQLLNPEDSCLIVAIDEKEYLRLGLLLEQLFPGRPKTMVSCVINPKGVPSNGFSRVNEYLFFIGFGAFSPQPFADDYLATPKRTNSRAVRWRGLSRTGADAVRSKSPGAYFPVFIDAETGTIRGAGPALDGDETEADVEAPEGTIAVWPTRRPSGEQGRWSVVSETFKALLSIGAVKAGKVDIEEGSFPLSYLTSEHLEQIDLGMIEVLGKDANGALEVQYAADDKRYPAKTVWKRTAHSASDHGSTLLRSFIPDRSFPFPKSLYAVEDALRVAVGDKPNALVLDFFAGSGTTSHAVFRLNRQDDGRRQSICVTNNELSDAEARKSLAAGLRQGDPEWEELGIFEQITRPRIEAALTGVAPDGKSVEGHYAFTDEFPMEEGFDENVEFFSLTYEDSERIAHNLAFSAVAPLLWMRAGARGPRIDADSQSFEIAETYGILFDMDSAAEFVSAVRGAPGMRVVYLVTDDDAQYQAVASQLESHLEAIRLYAAYLDNFRIVRRS